MIVYGNKRNRSIHVSSGCEIRVRVPGTSVNRDADRHHRKSRMLPAYGFTPEERDSGRE